MRVQRTRVVAMRSKVMNKYMKCILETETIAQQVLWLGVAEEQEDLKITQK